MHVAYRRLCNAVPRTRDRRPTINTRREPGEQTLAISAYGLRASSGRLPLPRSSNTEIVTGPESRPGLKNWFNYCPWPTLSVQMIARERRFRVSKSAHLQDPHLIAYYRYAATSLEIARIVCGLSARCRVSS